MMNATKEALQEHLRLIYANIGLHSDVKMIITNYFRGKHIFQYQASGGKAPMEVGAFCTNGCKRKRGKGKGDYKGKWQGCKGNSKEQGKGQGKKGTGKGKRRKLLRRRQVSIAVAWATERRNLRCPRQRSLPCASETRTTTARVGVNLRGRVLVWLSHYGKEAIGGGLGMASGTL